MILLAILVATAPVTFPRVWKDPKTGCKYWLQQLPSGVINGRHLSCGVSEKMKSTCTEYVVFYPPKRKK